MDETWAASGQTEVRREREREGERRLKQTRKRNESEKPISRRSKTGIRHMIRLMNAINGRKREHMR